MKAAILVTSFAVLFVILGDLNQLAILSTIPFLVTYAFVNYSYTSLAMSDDLDSLTHEIEWVLRMKQSIIGIRDVCYRT